MKQSKASDRYWASGVAHVDSPELATDPGIADAIDSSSSQSTAENAMVQDDGVVIADHSEQARTITSAKAELEQILSRIRNVKNSLLHEMNVYLHSLTDVETDYAQVLNNQEDEKARLESLAPDVFVTTSRSI